MPTKYQKGVRYEYKSRDLMKALGYYVTRAAGSHGLWDLVCVSPKDFVLIQCKVGTRPSKVELEAMKSFVCPENCVKVVHYWKPRASEPEVIIL